MWIEILVVLVLIVLFIKIVTMGGNSSVGSSLRERALNIVRRIGGCCRKKEA